MNICELTVPDHYNKAKYQNMGLNYGVLRNELKGKSHNTYNSE